MATKYAFLTCDNLDGFVTDDQIAIENLRSQNIEVEMVPWRENRSWADYKAVVIRTTWDYTDHLTDFLTSLERIVERGGKLINPLSVVVWNCNKKYLFDLEKDDIDIVPSFFIEKFDAGKFDMNCAPFQSEKIILKSTVSANAKNTFLLNRGSTSIPHLSILNGRQVLLQPFLKEVLVTGEHSLHFFNGEYSHTVRKVAKSGDYRVQEEHGGKITSVEPDTKLLQAAQKCMSSVKNKFGAHLLYARADMVMDDKGNWCVMELELIEPSLYLRTNKKAAPNFVAALLNFKF